MNWDAIKDEYETTDITLKALADKYSLKDSTIRSRKNRENWQRNDATQNKNVATKKSNATKSKSNVAKPRKRKEQKNRSGNPNPTPKFAERNRAAVKHGLFSRYIPKETLEIMGTLDKSDPADILWDQIQIQYAAIIRSQEIMFVASKDELIKELKRTKEGYSKDGSSSEEEYELQFAWDRQATFLNAQSKAIAELRSSIKHFDEMASAQDERRLKLEQMRLNIDKTKAEINKLDNADDDKPIEILIKRKGDQP